MVFSTAFQLCETLLFPPAAAEEIRLPQQACLRLMRSLEFIDAAGGSHGAWSQALISVPDAVRGQVEHGHTGTPPNHGTGEAERLEGHPSSVHPIAV